jgi:DNA-binding NarL/FixJ family response regulator
VCERPPIADDDHMTTATTTQEAGGIRARVVIADRHAGVRRALASLVALSGAGSVVGSVADLSGAGRIARASRADVLVVDADLLAGHRDELGLLPAATTIIALGMERHPGAASLAVRHGASAYLVKDQAHTGLAELLRTAVRPTRTPRRSRA